MQTEQLSVLWDRYLASPASQDGCEAKNDLVLSYVFLVKAIVRRMMPKYNAHNEFDDLVNCGVIGLMDAITKFDPSKGVKFETYAGTRISGEILDYMRSQDWAPPSLRKKISSVMRAYEALELKEQREVTDVEVAKELSMEPEQVREVMAKSHIFNVINFEDALTTAGTPIDVPDSEDGTPENKYLAEELRTNLTQLIAALPERDRQIITMYYYEGFLLRDIADILGVTESRVSQIHSRVLTKLRKGILND
ncbi:MAG: FliA/WhiG family RNA polymerase sigma factor [Oscillospiraceae bacterium]|jgi:RNA polymerase sigma factor for flagellar operon FliA|nr:FliA/WhiG family RNA polymerase sigma factor [Oscillospiraceae bacterium]